MNDFTKQKVAFAVALLAVLFTITPLLQPFGGYGFSLFSVSFTLIRLYYFLSGVLALAVYAYAIQFLTERDLRYPSQVGDLLYAIAVVTPVVYVLLFAILTLLETVRPLAAAPLVILVIEQLAAFGAGVVGSEAIRRLQRMLARRGRWALAEQLRQQEVHFLQRAETLLQAGHYNLCVLELWKAIDSGVRRLLIESGLPRMRNESMWTQIARDGLAPAALLEEISALRRIRNSAGNTAEAISREEATNALARAGKILASLELPPNETGDQRPA